MDNLRYNGKTIQEIENNLPKNITWIEKETYIKNCIEVANNELNGVNKGLNELIKNSNFNIINNCLMRSK